MRVLWLPQVLREAGLKVALQPGWESRGREMTSVAGIICHHTAGPATGNAPSLRIVTEGRSDLAGPLSQLVLGRDGTFYVVAAGRANHAGRGNWHGVTNGNGNFLGIEAEATGRDAWPAVQYEAYVLGVKAILHHLGRGPEWAAGHKEYALPAGRKPDPNFDMNAFRQAVGSGATSPHVPPQPPSTGKLAEDGNFGPSTIKVLQARLNDVGANPRLSVDGNYGASTKRMLQARLNHVAGPVAIDGNVGPNTIKALQRHVGVAQDGQWGPNTTKALQRKLNSGTF